MFVLLNQAPLGITIGYNALREHISYWNRNLAVGKLNGSNTEP